jgi:hypothetical protein
VACYFNFSGYTILQDVVLWPVFAYDYWGGGRSIVNKFKDMEENNGREYTRDIKKDW